MKNYLFLILILLILPQILSAQIAVGGGFSMEQSVVAAGGNTSSNGAFNLSGTTGQNAAGTVTTTSPFDQVGGFWTFDQLQPTAAVVSISGSVKTPNGNGIRNVMITLTDSGGSIRTTFTASFGTFRFTDVEVGQTYILSVSARKFSFPNPTQVVSVNDELTGLDFTGQMIEY